MKLYKDQGRYVREHQIKQGDLILLKRKQTKHLGPYDPEAYIAVQVRGSQITGERGDS